MRKVQITKQIGLDEVECPKCHKMFQISDAISHHMQEQADKIAEQKAEEKRDKERLEWEKEKEQTVKKAVQKAEAELSSDLKEKDTKINNLKKAANDFEEKELKWKKAIDKEKERWIKEKEQIEKKAFEKAESDVSVKLKEKEAKIKSLEKIPLEYEEKELKLKKSLAKEKEEWAKEKEQIEKKAHQKAEAKVLVELKSKDAELNDLRKTEKDFQEKQLTWIAEKREIEKDKRNWELKKQQELDEEITKIRSQESKRAQEESYTEVASLKKTILDMQKQLEEAQRKATQGSQQTQGEVAENDIEKLLSDEFHEDEIEPVKKGVRGADIIQKVFSREREIGKIILEVKNAKWDDGWIDKIKRDANEASADAMVLASKNLPKNISSWGMIKGVHVTNYSNVIPLIEVIRIELIKLHAVKTVNANKNERAEELLQYFMSPDFGHKISAILESYKSMDEQLRKEQGVIEKLWANREKEIKNLRKNTIAIYGSVQTLTGQTKTIPQLEFSEKELGKSKEAEKEEKNI